ASAASMAVEIACSRAASEPAASSDSYWAAVGVVPESESIARRRARVGEIASEGGDPPGGGGGGAHWGAWASAAKAAQSACRKRARMRQGQTGPENVAPGAAIRGRVRARS